MIDLFSLGNFVMVGLSLMLLLLVLILVAFSVAFMVYVIRWMLK